VWEPSHIISSTPATDRAGQLVHKHLVAYRPSTNITAEARADRLAAVPTPFVIDVEVPNADNPANTDIVWKPVLEDTQSVPPELLLMAVADHSSKFVTTDSAYTPNYDSPIALLSETDLPEIDGEESAAYAFVNITELPSGETPKTYLQAMHSIEKKLWRFATDSEMQSLIDADSWELVKQTDASNVVSGKWVFKIKKDKDGNVSRYKARWVARGFSQRENVDYTEIFAPVVRASSIRTLVAYGNAMDMDMSTADVSSAFTWAEVDERIFVEQPHGYATRGPNGEAMVCKLKKGLYGTKQAARLWNKKFHATLLLDGWQQFESDPCVYWRRTERFGYQLVGVYVDDILHLYRGHHVHKAFVDQCNKSFPTKNEGEVEWILGFRVVRNRRARTLTIDQSQALSDFLADNDYTELNPAITPMDTGWKHDSDSPLLDKEASTAFRSQLMSIAYWSQYTRPDVAVAVSTLCRHVSAPTDMCNAALRRLIRYLVGTINYGITYSVVDNNTDKTLKLEAFADSSWGGEDDVQGKSMSGYVTYFGGGPISWSTGLQSVIAQSSAEAELIAAYNCSTAAVYHRTFLEDLGMTMSGATTIWEDNTACIAMSKNPVNHKRCRHILVKYHYLRTLRDNNIVKLEYVRTADQIADLMTKPTGRGIFLKLRPFLVRAVQ
jgi:hypothetical protein